MEAYKYPPINREGIRFNVNVDTLAYHHEPPKIEHQMEIDT